MMDPSAGEQVVWIDTPPDGAVGPVMRSGALAQAVIDAVAVDNSGSTVYVIDRGDYVHVHTVRRCRLTRPSLQQALGEPIGLSWLEIEMPAFSGRLRTSDDEYVWYLLD